MTLTCIDCGGPKKSAGGTGRCRSCSLRHQNADPAFQARRRERLAIVTQDAGYRERHRQGSKRGAQQRLANPVQRERLRDLGRTFGAQNIHHAMTPEARAKCGEKIRAARLAWCPVEHWPLNQLLKRNGYRLAERKAMIADEVARAVREPAAPVTEPKRPPSFADTLARVAAGAALVPTFRPHRADHDYTLGGVATGML